MIEMYRTLYVWYTSALMEDSTKSGFAKVVLEKMEKNIPKDVITMDYRQKYTIGMFYYKLGDNIKFEEYTKDAYNEAYEIRLANRSNLQSYYNPYRILLDILEARGDLKTEMDLLKELNPNDPSVKQKMDMINSKLYNKSDDKNKIGDDVKSDKNP
jgi:hypothetical protein